MTNDVGGVRVAGIGVDKSEGAMVYNPGSPDADQNGYVRMPNVNITDEMIDLDERSPDLRSQRDGLPGRAGHAAQSDRHLARTASAERRANPTLDCEQR